MIATSYSYGVSQNSTFRNFVLPGPIITKLGMVDCVGDLYSDAILVTFGSVGNSPQIGKIKPLWLLQCSFFSWARLEENSVNGFARVMARNTWNQPRMCLLGVSSKMVTPTPTSPKIPKILHYSSRFSLKTRINLGVSAPIIRTRIGNCLWRFQFWSKKIDLKWNSDRFCACARENWLKIPQIVFKFWKFLVI